MSVESSSHRSSASHGPDESAFALGDVSDDEEDGDSTPNGASAHTPQNSTPSRANSVMSEVDDAVPIQLRGMSEKARGKMPAGAQPGISRQNSMTSSIGGAGPSINGNGMFEPSKYWLDSWLPNLPLHTILTVIDQLPPMIAQDKDVRHILRTIESTELHSLDVQPLRIHNFEWSPLSLGWYESLLWSFIYVNEMQVSKGTAGVWNGTAIKLFRVQEAAPEGVSLMRPRGAVDAVGVNIATRIGSLQLANRATELVGAARQATANGTSPGGDRASGGNGRSAVV